MKNLFFLILLFIYTSIGAQQIIIYNDTIRGAYIDGTGDTVPCTLRIGNAFTIVITTLPVVPDFPGRQSTILLPDTIYMIVDSTYYIYNSAIGYEVSDTSCFYSYICDIGSYSNGIYSITPQNSDIGTHQMIVNSANKDTTTIKVISGLNGKSNKTVLYLGHSWIYYGATARIPRFRENFDEITVTNVGSIGSAPNTHEGHTGKTVSYFLEDGSPTYIDGEYNFSKYRISTLGLYNPIDFIIIDLGLNEILQSVSTQTAINNLKILIDGMLADTVKAVFLCYDGETTDSAALWNDHFGNPPTTTMREIQDTIRSYHQKLYSNFDGGKYDNRVWMVPMAHLLNRENYFDYIHYGTAGKQETAKTDYTTVQAWLSIYDHDALTYSAGDDISICGGGSTTLNASVSNGWSPYIYTWSPATGLSSTTILNPVASPTITTTYTLNIRDSYTKTNDNIIVTVYSIPTANAGIDYTVVTGSSITLGGTPAAFGGSSPYLYSWTPVTGLNATSLSNPVATTTNNITYSINITDACNNTASDNMNIVVNAVSYDAGNDRTICSGASIVIGQTLIEAESSEWQTTLGSCSSNWLTSTVISGEIGVYPQNSFVWASRWISLNKTNNYTVTYEYTVGSTSNVSTIWVQAGHRLIGGYCPPKTQSLLLDESFISSTATGVYTLNYSNIQLTNLDTIFFFGNASGSNRFRFNKIKLTCSSGTSPYTYKWAPSSGLSSTSIQLPSANPTVTTTYVVTVIDAAGNTTTDDVIVYVLECPVANAGINQTISIGNSITLGGSPSASGGTSPYSYRWIPNSMGLSSTSVSNPTAAPTVTTTYRLTVNDINGCTNSTSVKITVTAGYNNFISILFIIILLILIRIKIYKQK